MVLIEIKLNELQERDLLNNGKIKVRLSQDEILKAIFKYNKSLKKINKKLLNQFTHMQPAYADFNKNDCVQIIYAKGTIDGTDVDKFNYKLVTKENIDLL